MKNIILLILSGFILLPLKAQQKDFHLGGYSAGFKSYLGLGYTRIWDDSFGLGANLALNNGTLSVNHTTALTITNGRINDGGEYDWVYNDEYYYDRYFLTVRAYLKVFDDEDVNPYLSKSLWFYLGVGPGEERIYYGYDRSEQFDTEYVRDKSKDIGTTELQFGAIWMWYDLFYFELGYSGINFSESSQLLFGFGLAVPITN